MKRALPLCAAIGAFAALALAAGPAEALPRFATRNGMHCWGCHVNPTGAGMRNEYGKAAFEMSRLAFLPLDRLIDSKGTAKRTMSSIGSNPTFGGDLRVAYLWVEELTDEDGEITNVPINGAFQMQADIYAHVRLGRWAELYLDQGITGAFEAFILVNFGDKGYLKAGRFVPPYGLKLPSHSSWIRERLGLLPSARDTGLEAGLVWGPFQISVMAAVPALSPDRTSGGVGLSAMAFAIGALGPLHYQIGLSGARRPKQAAPVSALLGEPAPMLDVTDGLDELMFGGFAGLALGRLAYHGEVDFIYTRERAIKGSSPVRSMVAYNELSLLIVQGIDLAATYEYWEPDFDLRSGAAWRAGAFIEFFPMAFLELRLMYRHTFGERVGIVGEDDVVVMLHGFF